MAYTSTPEEFGTVLQGTVNAVLALRDASDDDAAFSDVLSQLLTYFALSDGRNVALWTQIAGDSPDTDAFSSEGVRSSLFWSAVGDLMVFRAIALVDLSQALRRVGDGELEEERARLETDVANEAEVLPGLLQAQVLSRIRGGAGALDVLGVTAAGDVRSIANEATSKALAAAFTPIGGLLPHLGHAGGLGRTLRRVGKGLHLDHLLEWAQRILNLALDKLHHIFGPGFDTAVELVRNRVVEAAKRRDQIADYLYKVPELLLEVDRLVRETGPNDTDADIDELRGNLARLRDRFDKWCLGLDIGNSSLKWGWRASAVSPPVAAALAAVGVALGAAAFLIGQYHLDSPDLRLPWEARGILHALRPPV